MYIYKLFLNGYTIPKRSNIFHSLPLPALSCNQNPLDTLTVPSFPTYFEMPFSYLPITCLPVFSIRVIKNAVLSGYFIRHDKNLRFTPPHASPQILPYRESNPPQYDCRENACAPTRRPLSPRTSAPSRLRQTAV